ncbi:MAG: endolytic transglycosylase MltG, partial [Acidimicrobiaceae bacterium]
ADPWDDVSVVPETATEELRPGFDYLRGPVRMVVTMVVATVLLLGAAGWWTIHQLNPSGDPGAPVNFTINDGDTMSSVASRLDADGIIANATLFRWYASTKGNITLVPGYYALKPGDNAGNIIEALSTPPAQTFVSVTFPEGMTIAHMGERLSSKLTFMSQADFVAAATDGSIVSDLLPKGVTSLEGLLFPDTYQVSGDGSEARVVSTMAGMMQRVARQVDLKSGAKIRGFSQYEILIIASLIEREAKVPEDRAKIAQVIYNRLAEKMKLEIDASVKYGLDPEMTWTEMKATDHPYNTYIYPGLPPTPIANPGRASIQAALAPSGPPPKTDEACVGLPAGEKCRYLYYVLADKTGRHVFATTYEQHLANIEKSRAAGVLP